MTRAVMWLLLAVVAAAAAVLSFSALRDLASLCGFAPGLAWLLPVVIDAGAATGCLVWLGSDSSERARHFARALTWLLLASSVAGNAVVHGLSAYGLRPVWWLVVLVSAVAPAVLGAVVHLAVLVGRPHVADYHSSPLTSDDAHTLTMHDGIHSHDVRTTDVVADPVSALIEQGLGRRKLARELDISEYEARRLLASRNGVAR